LSKILLSSFSKSTDGVYSPNNPKNYTQDVVDLEVSGDFKKSFDLMVGKTFFELTADFEKEDSNIFDNFENSYGSFDSFSNFILGLRDEDFEDFIKKVFIPEFIKNYSKLLQDKISRL